MAGESEYVPGLIRRTGLQRHFDGLLQCPDRKWAVG